MDITIKRWVILLLFILTILLLIFLTDGIFPSVNSIDEHHVNCTKETPGTYHYLINIKPGEIENELKRRSLIARKQISSFPKFNKDIFNHLKPDTKGEYSSIGERCAIEYAQIIFNKPFYKIRPDWLINPATKRRLELDGYNEELGIAIEYNGIQHYKYTPRFHHCEEDYIKQVGRDEQKRKICKNKKILLIEIPYYIDYNNIGIYIYSQLLDSVPNSFELYSL